MKTKIVAFDEVVGDYNPESSKAFPQGKAEMVFRGMGLISDVILNVARTSDRVMELVGEGPVLVVGPQIDAVLPLAFSVGANVDVVQPRESEIGSQILKQTEILEQNIAFILKTAKIRGLDTAFGIINTTSFAGYLQKVGLPKHMYSAVVLPNVFDIQPAGQKPFFMKELSFSLKDNAVILVSFYGQKMERVLTLLQEIRDGFINNGLSVESLEVFEGSLSFDKTDVYKFNVNRTQSRFRTLLRNLIR